MELEFYKIKGRKIVMARPTGLPWPAKKLMAVSTYR